VVYNTRYSQKTFFWTKDNVHDGFVSRITVLKNSFETKIISFPLSLAKSP